MAPNPTPYIPGPHRTTEPNTSRPTEDGLDALINRVKRYCSWTYPCHLQFIIATSSKTVHGTSAEEPEFHLDPVEGMGSFCGRTAYVLSKTAWLLAQD
ncbi:uncharacterized protein LOC108666660 isoform X2 [Hyalella azteca]|uniref:Uncharacterized protein LOC108666660 isoform X2 n=1 Tax=Hyalella azteca TaxID=294128 RepID=A0A8B7N711_HYAAZ|nr:uncharacterized protein LOC108666660 isoform X2 [Hyalella azteca]